MPLRLLRCPLTVGTLAPLPLFSHTSFIYWRHLPSHALPISPYSLIPLSLNPSQVLSVIFVFPVRNSLPLSEGCIFSIKNEKVFIAYHAVQLRAEIRPIHRFYIEIRGLIEKLLFIGLDFVFNRNDGRIFLFSKCFCYFVV